MIGLQQELMLVETNFQYMLIINLYLKKCVSISPDRKDMYFQSCDLLIIYS